MALRRKWSFRLIKSCSVRVTTCKSAAGEEGEETGEGVKEERSPDRMRVEGEATAWVDVKGTSKGSKFPVFPVISMGSKYSKELGMGEERRVEEGST
jgi:hypothetical protein